MTKESIPWEGQFPLAKFKVCPPLLIVSHTHAHAHQQAPIRGTSAPFIPPAFLSATRLKVTDSQACPNLMVLKSVCSQISQKDAHKDEGLPERPQTQTTPSHLELRPVCSVELPVATVINTANYRDCPIVTSRGHSVSCSTVRNFTNLTKTFPVV